MADTLDTITKLIQSPPGQLSAGGVLAVSVWKFFERVESVLANTTKREIAAWLLGLKLDRGVQLWPDTFTIIFDRVFGTTHLSWKCFGSSAITSVALGLITLVIMFLWTDASEWRSVLGVTLVIGSTFIVMNVPLDYVSLWETRLILRFMRHSTALLWPLLMLCHLVLTLLTIIIGATSIWNMIGLGDSWFHSLEVLFFLETPIGLIYIVPALFTTLWLWLYAASGFLLIALRQLNLGFSWFSHRFDIEEKPLQSIGFVSGVIVALVYWSAVIVSRLI